MQFFIPYPYNIVILSVIFNFDDLEMEVYTTVELSVSHSEGP